MGVKRNKQHYKVSSSHRRIYYRELWKLTIFTMEHFENLIRKGSENEKKKSSLISFNSITCRLLTVTPIKSGLVNIDILDVSENQHKKSHFFSSTH